MCKDFSFKSIKPLSLGPPGLSVGLMAEAAGVEWDAKSSQLLLIHPFARLALERVGSRFHDLA